MRGCPPRADALSEPFPRLADVRPDEGRRVGPRSSSAMTASATEPTTAATDTFSAASVTAPAATAAASEAEDRLAAAIMHITARTDPRAQQAMELMRAAFLGQPAPDAQPFDSLALFANLAALLETDEPQR